MPLPSEPLCALTSAQTDGDQTGWTDQPAVLTRTRTHAHTLPVFLFKFNALWKTFYLLGFYSYPPNKQRSFSCSLLHIPLVPSPPCHIAEERCHQAAEKLTVTVTPSALRKLQCVAQMCIWKKKHTVDRDAGRLAVYFSLPGWRNICMLTNNDLASVVTEHSRVICLHLCDVDL